MADNPTHSELAARLREALKYMPRVRRDILLALRRDDASYFEVAEQAGLSVAQVERHFAEALVQLVDALEGPTEATRWRHLWRWLTVHVQQ